MSTIDHLAWPVRLTANGRFATVEQDTLAEHRQAVALVLTTPTGALIDNPDFGRREQAFKLGGADLGQLQASVTQWEPRTTQTVTPEQLAELAQRVYVKVGADG